MQITSSMPFTNTVSNNFADSVSPDDSSAGTVSGSLNFKTNTDATSFGRAFSLSGKNSTTDAKSLTFGLVGLGLSVGESLALGLRAAGANASALAINPARSQSASVVW